MASTSTKERREGREKREREREREPMPMMMQTGGDGHEMDGGNGGASQCIDSETTQGGFASVCGESALNDAETSSEGGGRKRTFDPKYEFSAPQWFDFVAQQRRDEEQVKRGDGATDERESLGDGWFDQEMTRNPALLTPETKVARPKEMQRVAQEFADETMNAGPVMMMPRNAVHEEKDVTAHVPDTTQNTRVTRAKETKSEKKENASATKAPVTTAAAKKKKLQNEHPRAAPRPARRAVASALASAVEQTSDQEPKQKVTKTNKLAPKPSGLLKSSGPLRVRTTTTITAAKSRDEEKEEGAGADAENTTMTQPQTHQHQKSKKIASTPPKVAVATKPVTRATRQSAIQQQAKQTELPKRQTRTSAPKADTDIKSTRVLRSSKTKTLTLTVPRSPEFAKRSRFTRGPVMSTEDRELLQVALAREEAAKRRKLNNTVAQRLHFTGRAGRKTRESIHMPSSSTRSRSRVVAMKTIHEKRKAQVSTVASGIRRKPPVTRSQTLTSNAPKLATDQRASMYAYTRPKPLSTAEREAREMASMPKFKAREVDARVLRSRGGDLGVPKLPKRKATEPVEPRFMTESRVGRKTRRFGSSVTTTKPAAAGGQGSIVDAIAPSSIGNTGCGGAAAATQQQLQQQGDQKKKPANSRPTLTVPVSPAFLTRYRTRAQAKSTLASAAAEPAKDKPPLRRGDVRPFDLKTGARGALWQDRFKRDMQKRDAKEKRDRLPRAALVPKTNIVPVIPPKPQSKKPTVPIPFELRSMTLHENALATWERDVQKQQEDENRLRKFVARDNPVFTSPKEREMPRIEPTKAVDVVLRTAARAPDRERFDEESQMKRDERAQARRDAMKMREEEEEKEVARLRKSLVFNAKPMPSYASESKPHLRSAAVRVTVPMSPVFTTRTRSMARAMR